MAAPPRMFPRLARVLRKLATGSYDLRLDRKRVDQAWTFVRGSTASIYRAYRLQWIMRDAAVVTQHHFISEVTYDSAGALFAGIPPGTPYP